MVIKRQHLGERTRDFLLQTSIGISFSSICDLHERHLAAITAVPLWQGFELASHVLLRCVYGVVYMALWVVSNQQSQGELVN